MADITAGLSLGSIQFRFSIKQSVYIMVTGAAVTSLVFHFMIERSALGLQSAAIEIPILVFIMRLFVKGGYGMAFFLNVELFPALERAKVFSITNVLSRVVAITAPMAVEYMHFVSLLIFGSSAICWTVPSLIKHEKKQDHEKEEHDELHKKLIKIKYEHHH